MVWKYVTLVTVALSSAPLVLRQAGDTEVQRQVLATDDRRLDALRRNDGAPLRQIYADDYNVPVENEPVKRPMQVPVKREIRVIQGNKLDKIIFEKNGDEAPTDKPNAPQ